MIQDTSTRKVSYPCPEYLNDVLPNENKILKDIFEVTHRNNCSENIESDSFIMYDEEEKIEELTADQRYRPLQPSSSDDSPLHRQDEKLETPSDISPIEIEVLEQIPSTPPELPRS